MKNAIKFEQRLFFIYVYIIHNNFKYHKEKKCLISNFQYITIKYAHYYDFFKFWFIYVYFNFKVFLVYLGNLQIINIKKGDEGVYVCEAENSAGPKISERTHLEVHGIIIYFFFPFSVFLNFLMMIFACLFLLFLFIKSIYILEKFTFIIIYAFGPTFFCLILRFLKGTCNVLLFMLIINNLKFSIWLNIQDDKYHIS